MGNATLLRTLRELAGFSPAQISGIETFTAGQKILKPLLTEGEYEFWF